jgi:hypothetical protein
MRRSAAFKKFVRSVGNAECKLTGIVPKINRLLLFLESVEQYHDQLRGNFELALGQAMGAET